MGIHTRYKKNILKQYGRHIKAHEATMDKQTLIFLQIPHFQKRGSRFYENYNSLLP